MPILKKLIRINESKAVVLPHSYFEYYKSKGKEINTVSLEIDDKIIIQPIFEDIVESEDAQKIQTTDISEIESHVNSFFRRVEDES